MKEFEWFEWFGLSPIEPFNPEPDGVVEAREERRQRGRRVRDEAAEGRHVELRRREGLRPGPQLLPVAALADGLY